MRRKTVCIAASAARAGFFFRRPDAAKIPAVQGFRRMTSPAARLNAFPVFFRVENRRIVIVGGGEEAFAKARLLAQSSADLMVVAGAPEESHAERAVANSVCILREPYDAALLSGAALVFAASGEEVSDRRVAKDARHAGIPVNAVDRPELCFYFTPSLFNRAPVAFPIGT
jgi:uroporphyrin-III C-methyltransferase/precorrin-2 dehydrogenase/sirohydrochlorin ferrochelatase